MVIWTGDSILNPKVFNLFLLSSHTLWVCLTKGLPDFILKPLIDQAPDSHACN
jgi:hypothetical protein